MVTLVIVFGVCVTLGIILGVVGALKNLDTTQANMAQYAKPKRVKVTVKTKRKWRIVPIIGFWF